MSRGAHALLLGRIATTTTPTKVQGASPMQIGLARPATAVAWFAPRTRIRSLVNPGFLAEKFAGHRTVSHLRLLATMSKKLKMTPFKQICTHSGSFHADEALAVYMLRLLPEGKDAKLVRSRDPAKWEESCIVVDVSGKYDGVKYFDHHQREFFETFSDQYKTKLSSAGLVYKHFGRQIVRALCPEISDEDTELLYEKVYRDFVEALDANDNGISNFDAEELGVRPRFHDKNISIPGIVAKMNPDWNEETSDARFDECFLTASAFVGDCFARVVRGYGRAWLPAKDIVRAGVRDRAAVDPSGRIVVLERFCPWKEHLYDVERELGLVGEVLFVLFADSSGSWRVSTVPQSATSFRFRHGLPEPWRGLRDDALSEATGVPGCIFVHAAGFIGGARTRDAALALARLSLPA